MRGILERGHDGFVKQVEKWEKMTPDERVEHLKELGGVLDFVYFVFQMLQQQQPVSDLYEFSF